MKLAVRKAQIRRFGLAGAARALCGWPGAARRAGSRRLRSRAVSDRLPGGWLLSGPRCLDIVIRRPISSRGHGDLAGPALGSTAHRQPPRRDRHRLV